MSNPIATPVFPEALLRLVENKPSAGREDFTAEPWDRRIPNRAIGALANDPRIKNRFDRNSEGLTDNSDSGVDLSLASLLAHQRLSGPEIEATVRASRALEGLDGRNRSYYQSTVGKALAGAEKHPAVSLSPARIAVQRLPVPFSPVRPVDDVSGLSAQYIVKNLVPSEATGFLSAKYGESKTFFALDLASAVADGRPFFGLRTMAGLVFYACGEGQVGIEKRLRALRLTERLTSENLFKRPLVPNLLADVSVEEFIQAIKAVETDRKQPVRLIIIDTLNRAMPGADENSSEATGKAIASADWIRREFPGSSVLIVAHFGKDSAKGVRGHSSLESNADFLINLKRDRITGMVTWEAKKQKDGELTAPRSFQLNQVDLGVRDEDGDPLTSCVIEQVLHVGGIGGGESGLGRRAGRVWAAVQTLIGPSPTTKTTTRDALHDALRSENQNASTRRSTVNEGLRQLIDRGLVYEREGLIGYPTERPFDE